MRRSVVIIGDIAASRRRAFIQRSSVKQLDRRLRELHARIARGVAAYQHLREDGATHVPHLRVGRITQPLVARPYLYEPSICVCAEGEKHVLLGNQRYTYDPGRFLFTSIGLPTIIEVPDASAHAPYTALQVRLDLAVARQVVAEMENTARDAGSVRSGFAIAPLDEGLLDALARLVALLAQPDDVRVLAPLLHKEIVYRLLAGPAGDYLRHTLRDGSPSNKVSEAVAWLRIHYAKACRVDELARICGVGVATLYRQFRDMTTMTPIQYQKLLRLHAARRLMLSEELDAASAAMRVGYESPTQFSREYRRLFGQPPGRDISAMRNGRLMAAARLHGNRS